MPAAFKRHNYTKTQNSFVKALDSGFWLWVLTLVPLSDPSSETEVF